MGHDEHGHKPQKTAEDIEIEKILARAETQNFSEAPKYTASDFGGVVPTDLAGRFANERHRLGPDFTEADRHWRIKWHQDQALRDSEPFYVPALNQYNIFRRIYRAPLNILENQLAKYMHRNRAEITRKLVGRSIMMYFIVVAGWYHLRHNTANWEVYRGVRVYHSREIVLPGDPRYPMASPRTESWQHYDRGFHDRKVFLKQNEIAN